MKDLTAEDLKDTVQSPQFKQVLRHIFIVYYFTLVLNVFKHLPFVSSKLLVLHLNYAWLVKTCIVQQTYQPFNLRLWGPLKRVLTIIICL